jgi:hypothetical protein
VQGKIAIAKLLASFLMVSDQSSIPNTGCARFVSLTEKLTRGNTWGRNFNFIDLPGAGILIAFLDAFETMARRPFIKRFP